MRLKAIALVIPLLLAAGTSKETTGDPKTQSIMHGIFAPMAVLLPLSFDGDAFADPKNASVISKSVDQLRDEMAALTTHAKKRSEAFQFVAASLERDVVNVARLYHAGQFDQSRFVLHNLTENCVSCHSSLPEAHRFQGAAPIIAAIKKDGMDDSEVARFLVMSRQFDEAMDVYERLIVPKATDPVGFGDFLSYLKVAIRVKHDLKRPQKAM